MSPNLRRTLLAAILASGALALVPAAGQAAVQTFGSSLAVPATMDTTHNLNYGVPTAPAHDGADTALWNVALASGAPASPADGQILSTKLEGCAQPATGGPSPTVDFHFQSLTPQGGGAVKVNVTSQAFQIPICGVNGAGAGTITTYQPTNFCVRQGDYVDFNDEGGFNSQYYPSGVPYQVIGSVTGSTMDSFIQANGTNNGATLSPTTIGTTNGFATNPNKELMLQATLGTGPDGTPLCPGGTAGQQQSQPTQTPTPTQPQTTTTTIKLAALKIRSQTDGVNHSGMVKLAIYCAQTNGCTGGIALMSGSAKLGAVALNVPGKKTSKVAMRLTSKSVKMIRKHHRRLSATMLVTLTSGETFTGAIKLKL